MQLFPFENDAQLDFLQKGEREETIKNNRERKTTSDAISTISSVE